MVARLLLLSSLCAFALTACGAQESESRQETRLEAAGRYDIDPATGSVSAEHTDADGMITRLEAGGRLPVALPEPFTLFPGAEVLHNTRVEQADARLVYLDFTTDKQVADVVAFYRAEAMRAGIATHVDIGGSDIRTLGGENLALQLRFSLTARREGAVTTAQLVVGRGF